LPQDRFIQPSTDRISKPESVSELARLLAARWRFVLMVALACAFCAAVISLIIPNKYTAISTILPTAKSSGMGGLLSLAENMSGVDLMGLGGADNSPSQLYPDILKSRQIVDSVLGKEYSYQKRGRIISQNLYQYLEEKNADRAARALSLMVSIDNDKKTGIISISATTDNPELSALIANYYVERLDDFNKNQRQTNAGQNRTFIEKRMAEAKAQLEDVEDNLKQLRQHNLNYYNSTDPELALLIGQLTREIEVKTQVYLTLSQQYELAAIQEKKELPIVQVLDSAKPPTVKSGPARTKVTLIGFFMGILLAGALVFMDGRGRTNDIYNFTRLSIKKLHLRRSRYQDNTAISKHVEQH
jgi:uncharacterized protein involved in exopolysaccharide biosynthesis